MRSPRPSKTPMDLKLLLSQPLRMGLPRRGRFAVGKTLGVSNAQEFLTPAKCFRLF